MAKKCLKSKVGTPVVGCKQNPSYSIRGAIEFGKSMPFSCLWQSVTHMVTIDIGVDSSSNVDMVSQVVDIHGPTLPIHKVRLYRPHPTFGNWDPQPAFSHQIANYIHLLPRSLRFVRE